MMKKHLVFIGLLILLLLQACKQQEESPRTRISFNNQWSFYLGEMEDAIKPEFDVSQWRQLNLPHDWAIEGDFSQSNRSGVGGGALPGGIGWYRKSFDYTLAMKDKRVFIDFDGIYMNAEVFLNGTSLGKRPYGYISVRYDMTPYLKEGNNVLAVRVDNREQPNSRWYSGCGIYRNVWMVITDAVHVAHWGTFVTTPQVDQEKAQVRIQNTIQNETDKKSIVTVTSLLINPKGRVMDSTSQKTAVEAGQELIFSVSLKVNRPELWSVETPTLYTARTEIRREGVLVDRYDTPFGIRSFRFDAQKGFILNDKQVKIKGVCQHHDLGCLGAAINTRALERQLQILKNMGCNGIRCSHNPPSPELLNLCDRMGFIVMDETFDMWRKKKTRHDYARYFNDWYERDLTDHVMRDRNHPSIFMWSVGNEVLEQWTDARADTLTLAEANLLLNLKRDESSLSNGDSLSVNSLLTQKIDEMIKTLDPTRPTTAGCNEPNPRNHLFKAGVLDIIGFNYHEAWFKDVPTNFPGKPFICTEATSALMTRGYYRMPSDTIFHAPSRWDRPYYDSTFFCSSYDNCHAPWGSTHEEVWKIVRDNDFVSGMYIWTGFDYIGEPTPYGWPARSSYFGIIDLAGFPKDVYYLYQSEWTDQTVLHLFPHWNWTEGQEVDLWAYYNHADEVELFINGKSQGVKKKEGDAMHVFWRVKYEPGTIQVISRKDGKEVAKAERHTAGEPAEIRLTPDRSKIQADGTDLSFVTVEVVDKEGNLCPLADNLIQFEISGSGFIAGVDNGSQISHEKFKVPQRKAFFGKCLAVVQNSGEKGSIRLTATAENLKTAQTTIQVK